MQQTNFNGKTFIKDDNFVLTTDYFDIQYNLLGMFISSKRSYEKISPIY
jgi:hypothetical protein